LRRIVSQLIYLASKTWLPCHHNIANCNLIDQNWVDHGLIHHLKAANPAVFADYLPV